MRPAKTFMPLLWAVATLAGVSGVHISFDDPDPPKIIAVMAMQRSGSSTMAKLISSQKCAINGKEIWLATPEHDNLDGHGLTGHNKAYSSAHPVEFMLAVNKAVCKSDLIPEECNGQCTIVVKFFDIHGVKADGVKNFLLSPDVGVVMLERETSDWYSSNMNARANNDWKTTPSASRPAQKVFSDTPPKFQSQHDEWYSFLRSTLREADKVYIEVPFAAVKTCTLFNRVLPAIFTLFGFDTAEGVEFKNMYDKENLDAIAEDCQDVQL